MFITFVHTKFHVPVSKDPLVTAVKLKSKWKYLHGHHVVLYSTVTMSYISKIYYHTSPNNITFSDTNIIPSSHVHHIIRNNTTFNITWGRDGSAVAYPTNFVQIENLFKMLNGQHTHTQHLMIFQSIFLQNAKQTKNWQKQFHITYWLIFNTHIWNTYIINT
jgi:hypothetical protein